MLPVSSPASGSVTPKHTVVRPAMTSGSQRRFCSSLPKTTMGCGPNILMCTVDAALMAPAERAMVCIMMAASVMPSPEPPNASGMAMPSQPPSTSASRNASGKRAEASHSRQ